MAESRQETVHELIERAEHQLDAAAALLRQVRITVAAGELPVRRDGVVLSIAEASYALDTVAAFIRYNPRDPRLGDLHRLAGRLGDG